MEIAVKDNRRGSRKPTSFQVWGLIEGTPVAYLKLETQYGTSDEDIFGEEYLTISIVEVREGYRGAGNMRKLLEISESRFGKLWSLGTFTPDGLAARSAHCNLLPGATVERVAVLESQVQDWDSMASKSPLY